MTIKRSVSWFHWFHTLGRQWPSGPVAISGLGYPRIFAVGDCNYSCVDELGKKPDDWPIPPIPKISYPGEEMPLGEWLGRLGGRWLKRL